MKKLLFLTVLSMLFAVNAAAQTTKSGTINSTINWTYYIESHTLKLSGSGALPDYNAWTVKKHYFRTDENALIEEEGYIMDVVENIEIEGDINTIGKMYFSGAEYLEKLTLSGSVAVIKDEAFRGCISLSEIDGIINNDIEVASSAFEGCQFIAENDGILVMGNTLVVAYSDFGLVTITVPENVTKIKSEAFINYQTLQKIIFEGNLTSIGDEAFSGCTNLETLNIPNTVTTWGKDIFSGCTSLPNDGTYQKAGDHVIVKVVDKTKKIYTIDEDVIYIGESAFEACNNIEYIKYEGTDAPKVKTTTIPGDIAPKIKVTIVPNGSESNYTNHHGYNINTTTIHVNEGRFTSSTFLHNAILPKNVGVYVAEDCNGENVTFRRLNENLDGGYVIPAGKGVFLKAINAGNYTFKYTGNNNYTEEDWKDNYLVGVEEDKYLTKDDKAYILQTDKNNVQKLVKVTSNYLVPMCKSYFNGLSLDSNAAKTFSIRDFMDEETGIDKTEEEPSNSREYEIYNLAGQKLNKMQDGLNIVNGKIVIN